MAIVTRDAMIGVAQVEPGKKQPPGFSQRRAQRQVSDMHGNAALPRKSGELQFQDPWEGEAFAMAVALCEQHLYEWSEFQERLIAEIASADRQAPETRPTYYESWLTAFEKLLDAKSILAYGPESYSLGLRRLRFSHRSTAASDKSNGVYPCAAPACRLASFHGRMMRLDEAD